MSATNSTTHYELPVFIATDKPAWLVDWNGSMNSIDAGIYEAKAAADTAAAGVAANASDISTLSSTVTTQGSSLSTLSENLTTLTGAVNTINSLIGNGEPTTTDKTIIGAINEINAEITSPTAAGISYDNTTSGLTADDVQEAIDENAADIATVSSYLPDLTTDSSDAHVDVDYYKIKDVKIVSLSIHNLDKAADAVIFTLPTGYRPAAELTRYFYGSVNGNAAAIAVKIKTNGEIVPTSAWTYVYGNVTVVFE